MRTTTPNLATLLLIPVLGAMPAGHRAAQISAAPANAALNTNSAAGNVLPDVRDMTPEARLVERRSNAHKIDGLEVHIAGASSFNANLKTISDFVSKTDLRGAALETELLKMLNSHENGGDSELKTFANGLARSGVELDKALGKFRESVDAAEKNAADATLDAIFKQKVGSKTERAAGALIRARTIRPIVEQDIASSGAKNIVTGGATIKDLVKQGSATSLIVKNPLGGALDMEVNTPSPEKVIGNVRDGRLEIESLSTKATKIVNENQILVEAVNKLAKEKGIDPKSLVENVNRTAELGAQAKNIELSITHAKATSGNIGKAQSYIRTGK